MDSLELTLISRIKVQKLRISLFYRSFFSQKTMVFLFPAKVKNYNVGPLIEL
jgi:hypothetical protein